MIHPWNRSIWERLPALDRLPPVLLLTGPRGIGKGAFALTLAKALLCQTPRPVRDPCGACSPCRLFDSGNHPDFRLLEPAAAEEEAGDETTPKGKAVASGRWIKVDEVRAMADLLAFSSHLGGRKVVLIEPADRLHPSASNALLKVLEEPPAATHFLLVTADAGRLPATVISRCVRVTFALPAADAAVGWLRERGARQAELALAQAGFAPLAALSLDTPEYWAVRSNLIEEVLAKVQFDPVGAVDSIGTDQLARMLGALQRWCYDLVSIKSGGSVRYNPDCAQILHRLAARTGLTSLLQLDRELKDATRWIDHPLNTRLVAERCLIGYRNALGGWES